MTDANLMDAECIHGIVWYECETCGEELGEMLMQIPPNYGGESC